MSLWDGAVVLSSVPADFFSLFSFVKWESGIAALFFYMLRMISVSDIDHIFISHNIVAACRHDDWITKIEGFVFTHEWNLIFLMEINT